MQATDRRQLTHCPHADSADLKTECDGPVTRGGIISKFWLKSEIQNQNKEVECQGMTAPLI